MLEEVTLGLQKGEKGQASGRKAFQAEGVVWGSFEAGTSLVWPGHTRGPFVCHIPVQVSDRVAQGYDQRVAGRRCPSSNVHIRNFRFCSSHILKNKNKTGEINFNNRFI